jgi:hypothetical protein
VEMFVVGTFNTISTNQIRIKVSINALQEQSNDDSVIQEAVPNQPWRKVGLQVERVKS